MFFVRFRVKLGFDVKFYIYIEKWEILFLEFFWCLLKYGKIGLILYYYFNC